MTCEINPPVPAPKVGTSVFALLCLLLVGTLLAASIILSKMAAVASAPMLWFLAVLMAGSGAILLIVAGFAGQLHGQARPLIAYGLISGAFMAGASALGYLTVSHVGASYISLTFAFPILLTYVLALVLRMERLKWMKAAAVGCGLTGGLLLALSKFDATAIEGWGWVALASSMPLIIAFGNIYRTRHWPEDAGSILLAALMLLLGAMVLVPFAAFFEGNAIAMLWHDPRLALYVVAGIIIFCVQYVFYFMLQYLAGPVYLSQIGSVAAVVGALIAFGFMNETPPAGLALAGTLIAIGIALFQIEQVHRRSTPDAA